MRLLQWMDVAHLAHLSAAEQPYTDERCIGIVGALMFAPDFLLLNEAYVGQDTPEDLS